MKSFPLFIVLLYGLTSPLSASLSLDDSPPKIVTPSQKNKEDGVVIFTPPKGWMLADSSALPKSVRVMVIGKGKKALPPSMNLAVQPYKGTLKEYLRKVKAKNEAENTEWKDLGNIRTEAGVANLSQVNRKTEWGDECLMHAILLKDETIYILTASALKEEFASFYKDFFNAMRSLRINNNVFDMVKDIQLRNQLKANVDQLKKTWKTSLNQLQQNNPSTSLDNLKSTLFDNTDFQKQAWIPFKDMIKQDFGNMGAEWQSFVLQKIENDLFEMN